jgi:hypothetical protein
MGTAVPISEARSADAPHKGGGRRPLARPISEAPHKRDRAVGFADDPVARPRAMRGTQVSFTCNGAFSVTTMFPPSGRQPS